MVVFVSGCLFDMWFLSAVDTREKEREKEKKKKFPRKEEEKIVHRRVVGKGIKRKKTNETGKHTTAHSLNVKIDTR